MFRLASLACYGCRYSGKQNVFYDDNLKRPCFSQCGHSLCTECIQKFTDCPICQKKVIRTENFTARVLLEDYRKNPMMVLKNWWNANGNERETCTRCSESCGNLRLCITCYTSKLDFIVVYGDPDKEKPWEKNEDKRKRRELIEEYQKKVIYSEIDPDADMNEIDLKIYFHCDFSLFANLACCPGCVLDYHEGHLVNTREELDPIIDVFKQSASKIATSFFTSEIRKLDGKCRLRTMRMRRTCEKMCHIVNNYFRSPDGVIRVPDIHLSRRSYLNKFFDPLPWENIDCITREDVNEMIDSLENQMKAIHCQEECKCNSIWEEMHNLSFSNQIERKFIEVIEGLGNRKISECPFPDNEFQNVLDKAFQLSEMKLHLLYTAFCWNHEKTDVCCLFDNFNHKPCICPDCRKASCLDCFKESSSKKCPFCGIKHEMIPINYVPEIDNEVLTLVSFYKQNCVELLENWWFCEASHLGFCLKCGSYSDDLEVCVFCELYHKPSALITVENGDSRTQFKQSDRLFFNYKGLKTFPIRWQCSDCQTGIIEEWVHRNSKTSVKGDVDKKWKRGCGHPKSRVSSCSLRSDDCEYKSIAFKYIENFELAMKVATMGLVFRVLRSVIEEKFVCKKRKIKILKAVGMLKTKIHRYFMNSLGGNKRIQEESLKVSESIKNLKKEWTNYQNECSCINIWNDANYLMKRELRQMLKNQQSEGIDECILKTNSVLKQCENTEDELDISWIFGREEHVEK